MIGIPFEPSPKFGGEVVFLPESAAFDKNVTEKLKEHVKSGGCAVITTGFLKAALDSGIKDMTSARPTGRSAQGNEYWIQGYGESRTVASGAKPIRIEAIDYKTNASWCEIALLTDYNSFPVLIHDFYGKGHLYILNMPEDFGDICALPKEAAGFINKAFARNNPYIVSAPRICSFTYDNGVIGVFSQNQYAGEVEIFVPDKYTEISDLETGEALPLLPARQSAGRYRARENEILHKSAKVYLPGGGYRFFKMK
jgi:hypothetical protein